MKHNIRLQCVIITWLIPMIAPSLFAQGRSGEIFPPEESRPIPEGPGINAPLENEPEVEVIESTAGENQPQTVTTQRVAPDEFGLTDTQAGVSVMMHGPVHEAFAAPYSPVVSAGTVVTTEPPAAINETPPALIPEGENVQWLPGYFQWDDLANDFLWISGIYRDVPPGQRWIPGVWTPVTSGYQWSPGFWVSAETAELTYLPTPPPAREETPVGDPPTANSYWVPGQWRYANGNYQWSNGFWTEANRDWVWTPARYVWTPSGFVYSAGFWDYPLTLRGTLFAPVAINADVSSWTPQVAVPAGPLLTNLFTRADVAQYYFGNYYGDELAALGFTPWINSTTGTFRFDPLLNYYTTIGAGELLTRIRGWNEFYLANPTLRPPLAFAEFDTFNTSIQRLADVDPVVADVGRLAVPLRTFADPSTGLSTTRFTSLDESSLSNFRDTVQQFNTIIQNRRANVTAEGRVGDQAIAGSSLALPEMSAFRADAVASVGTDELDSSVDGRLPDPPVLRAESSARSADSNEVNQARETTQGTGTRSGLREEGVSPETEPGILDNTPRNQPEGTSQQNTGSAVDSTGRGTGDARGSNTGSGVSRSPDFSSPTQGRNANTPEGATARPGGISVPGIPNVRPNAGTGQDARQNLANPRGNRPAPNQGQPGTNPQNLRGLNTNPGTRPQQNLPNAQQNGRGAAPSSGNIPGASPGSTAPIPGNSVPQTLPGNNPANRPQPNQAAPRNPTVNPNSGVGPNVPTSPGTGTNPAPGASPGGAGTGGTSGSGGAGTTGNSGDSS